jgi:ABC-type lipoprotein export system ATPase subunit
MTNKIIIIKNLIKTYDNKEFKIDILKNINFELLEGETVSIQGPSGSGKSTFLNILGLLDSNYEGNYIINNQDASKLDLNQKNKFRNNSIGFVHQFFHLIPELTVLENIALPKMIKTNSREESFNSAKILIDEFKLSDRIYFKPKNLSGGEQQRVAIARALINNPQLIIADEMTGNLDEENSDLIFDFFLSQIKIARRSLIYVTHNHKYAEKADFKYKIQKKDLVRV